MSPEAPTPEPSEQKGMRDPNALHESLKRHNTEKFVDAHALPQYRVIQTLKGDLDESSKQEQAEQAVRDALARVRAEDSGISEADIDMNYAVRYLLELLGEPSSSNVQELRADQNEAN